MVMTIKMMIKMIINKEIRLGTVIAILLKNKIPLLQEAVHLFVSPFLFVSFLLSIVLSICFILQLYA